MAVLLAISIVFYLLAVVGVVLHPYVSVSTGELKPRSLFIDEHAIPLHSTIVDRSHTYDDPSGILNTFSCEMFQKLARYCRVDAMKGFMEIHITPKQVPMPLDRTALYFISPTVDGNAALQKEVLKLVWNIATQYREASWGAKQLGIVISPSSEHLTMLLRSQFGDSHHTGSRMNSPLFSAEATSTLTREAYIINLSPLSSGNSLQWRSSHILTHDHVGNQPNMDLVTYLFHRHGEVLSFPKCQHQALVLNISEKVTALTKSVLPSFLLERGNARKRTDTYFQNLCSRSVGTVDDPGRSLEQAMHVLLGRNVDAISLSLQPSSVSSIGVRQDQRQRKKQFPNRLRDGKDLVYLLLDLVFMSNYLEEELHHSYQVYFLMGEQTFVGLNEYGLVALLFLLAPYVLLLHLWYTIPVAVDQFERPANGMEPNQPTEEAEKVVETIAMISEINEVASEESSTKGNEIVAETLVQTETAGEDHVSHSRYSCLTVTHWLFCVILLAWTMVLSVIALRHPPLCYILGVLSYPVLSLVMLVGLSIVRLFTTAIHITTVCG